MSPEEQAANLPLVEKELRQIRVEVITKENKIKNEKFNPGRD